MRLRPRRFGSASKGNLRASNGVAWAWGSLLYQAADQSVGEVGYLYVGFCNGTKDSEASFYSDEPVEVCKPPQIPR